MCNGDRLSRMRNWLLGRGDLCWKQIWLFRHYDPSNDVPKKSDAGAKGGNEPHDTDERYIYIEVFGQAKADAGNLAAFARANQALARDDTTDSRTAVGADIRVILNRLAAVVTVHNASTP